MTLDEIRAELKKRKAKMLFLKNGIEKFPPVLMADGVTEAEPEYLQYIIALYLSEKIVSAPIPQADETAGLLDRISLAKALEEIYSGVVNEKNKALFMPALFRYGSGQTVTNAARTAGNNRYTKEAAEKSLLFSDTHEAMIIAEKEGRLDSYASLRGTDADTLRDTTLADFGLDDDGKKTYDLGGTTIVVSLQNDLTLALYDTKNAKFVRSIPKKGNDESLVKKASADLSEIKRNVKKIAKLRSDKLFEAFLDEEEIPADKWKAAYLGNALLRHVAELLVWKQDKALFTLNGKAAILADGKEYTLTDSPIILAHPMEMTSADIKAWQKYFTSHGLKQPFAQVWEPVIDPITVKKDRYSGITLPVKYTLNSMKHGLYTSRGYDYCDLCTTLSNCSLQAQNVDYETYKLGDFTFKTYDRRVNHLVATLDRWTIYGRIRKDDVSVAQYLDRFTLAQITEFINAATESNATNVTALLLEHKNKNYADFDPMDEFVLE